MGQNYMVRKFISYHHFCDQDLAEFILGKIVLALLELLPNSELDRQSFLAMIPPVTSVKVHQV